MAYLNLLASVPEVDLERFRGNRESAGGTENSEPAGRTENREEWLRPSLVVGVSHLVASWISIQPLGQALDGGNRVHPELWHPLRVPLFHTPNEVRQLATEVDAAIDPSEIAGDIWLTHELGQVRRLFRHAAGRGECVVSVLQPPVDPERASRVRMLWK